MLCTFEIDVHILNKFVKTRRSPINSSETKRLGPEIKKNRMTIPNKYILQDMRNALLKIRNTE